MNSYNKELAGMIDHTILNLDATDEELKKVCSEAKEYSFASVCVYPKHIPLVKSELEGSSVLPIAVIDFPKGSGTPEEKEKETKEAIELGAKEIDMVIDKEALKSLDYETVFNGIKKVVTASGSVPVKVIIESAELTHMEKISACVLSKAAGAKFVKTSTGFGKGGASVADVSLMRRIVGEDIGVKASGGIRNTEAALAMKYAGASRIGASASVAIVEGGSSNSDY